MEVIHAGTGWRHVGDIDACARRLIKWIPDMAVDEIRRWLAVAHDGETITLVTWVPSGALRDGAGYREISIRVRVSLSAVEEAAATAERVSRTRRDAELDASSATQVAGASPAAERAAAAARTAAAEAAQATSEVAVEDAAKRAETAASAAWVAASAATVV